MGSSEALISGKARTGAGGARIDATQTRETKSAHESPSLVALHEAAHVFVAFMCGAGVHNANIEPDGPIQGTTWLKKFSAIALAAGAALGDHAGAGGDREIARVNKVDWKTAVSEARALIAGNMHVIRAIASALQKWKSLGDEDLQGVFDEAKNGAEITLAFTDSDGDTHTETTRTSPGTKEVKIPAWMLAALLQAGSDELDELKEKGVHVLPARRQRTGVKVDVMTEKDLSDLQRDV